MRNIISKTCPLTGLSIITNPDWEDIKIDDNYQVSYRIIGDRIILGEGRGSADINSLKQALGVASVIIKEYFENKEFVYIEDFSNIMSPTTEGRKYYINFMKGLKNMKALVYYRVSPFMKLSIKLALKLNMYSFDVFLTKNYSHAVNKALEILDKSQNNAFIAENKLKWELHLGKFTAKYEIINDNIFHVMSDGIFDFDHVDTLFEFQEKLIKENLYDKLGEYYFVVGLNGLKITRKARKIYSKKIQSLYNRLPFKSYIYYGGSRLLNIVIAMTAPHINFKHRGVSGIEEIIKIAKSDETKRKKHSKKDPIQTYVDEFLTFLSKIDWEKEGIRDYSIKETSHPLYQIYDAITLIKSDIDELYLEKKRSEEEKTILQHKLQESLKLEAMGKLAGSVAHDLNNVLSGIVSYPDIILRELPKNKTNEKVIRYIERMKITGQKAANIVQDLLNMTRRGVVNFEPININSIINEYLNSPEFKQLREIYPNIKVEYKPDKNLKNISASAIHLSKTIMNLITNSMEAIKDKGIVKILTENVILNNKFFKGYDNNANGDYIKLIISDNGSGISLQDIPRIFEPFYSKKIIGRSGTGLGMLVVKTTVDDHNGFIELNSELGVGTNFSLYFPIEDKQIDKKIVEKIENYSGKGETILVIDDDKDQQIISYNILKGLHYSVKTVGSGEEAIEYLKKNSVDLIILDMIMSPGINGFETYKKIIKINPKQKAIIVSGYSESAHVKETQTLGAGQYIKKPYTIEDIGMAVYKELN